MSTPLDYAGLKAACLAQLAVAQPPFASATGDERFQQIFPMALNDAEGLIYREIPFLNTRKVDTSLTTNTGRTVSLASLSPAVSIPERFALLVSGGRVVFDRTDFSVVDTIWPTGLTVAPNALDFQPRYWAMQDDQTIVYAPTADQAYTVELVGLFQPVPMGPGAPTTSTTTYIGNVYPELLMSAVMFYLNGGLKQNFGQMVDDPRSAMTWKAVVDEHMTAAKLDEMRRRGMAPSVPVMPAPAKVQ